VRRINRLLEIVDTLAFDSHGMVATVTVSNIIYEIAWFESAFPHLAVLLLSLFWKHVPRLLSTIFALAFCVCKRSKTFNVSVHDGTRIACWRLGKRRAMKRFSARPLNTFLSPSFICLYDKLCLSIFRENNKWFYDHLICHHPSRQKKVHYLLKSTTDGFAPILPKKTFEKQGR
jgi:hypothetical protein